MSKAAELMVKCLENEGVSVVFGLPGEENIRFVQALAASNIRFGAGVTREVGMDLREIGARNVLVMTDPVVARLPPAIAVLESLETNGIAVTVYDRVRVEHPLGREETQVALPPGPARSDGFTTTPANSDNG